jgi:NAD(P)-dependent dehydrogenase (short-subunit alcohol dehydrogenase family)
MPRSPGRLDGARVLVCDGSTRIGRATVARLESEGARVSCSDNGAGSGALDGLVVQCGAARHLPLTATEDTIWDELLESHILTPWRLICASASRLTPGRGSVVVIASAADDWPSTTLGAHSVLVHGLVAMVRMFGTELAPQGLRVNAVCPDCDADTGPDRRSPEEVARTVAFLLSADAGACNATTVLLDGGRRASLTAGSAVAT